MDDKEMGKRLNARDWLHAHQPVTALDCPPLKVRKYLRSLELHKLARYDQKTLKWYCNCADCRK